MIYANMPSPLLKVSTAMVLNDNKFITVSCETKPSSYVVYQTNFAGETSMNIMNVCINTRATLYPS